MALINSDDLEKKAEKRKYKKQLENMDCVQYSLRIPSHLHHLFRQKLILNKKTMRSVLVDYIKRYVEK